MILYYIKDKAFEKLFDNIILIEYLLFNMLILFYLCYQKYYYVYVGNSIS